MGGIVFAEHFVFPRIGLTRYWVKYRGLKHSTPSVVSWAAGLVFGFGFGLNYLQVMSFFYLFFPTCAFTIVLYTFLASRYGAAESYPAEEAAEQKMNDAIQAFQAQQALSEGKPKPDDSVLSKVLQGIAWLALAVTFVMALIVMFASDDMAKYESRVEVFYTWSFVCTIVYFGSAYWALQCDNRYHVT